MSIVFIYTEALHKIIQKVLGTYQTRLLNLTLISLSLFQQFSSSPFLVATRNHDIGYKIQIQNIKVFHLVASFYQSYFDANSFTLSKSMFKKSLGPIIKVDSIIFKTHTFFIRQSYYDTPPLHIIQCLFYKVQSFEENGGALSIKIEGSKFHTTDFQILDTGFYKCSSSYDAGAAEISTDSIKFEGNCFTLCQANNNGMSLNLKHFDSSSFSFINRTAITFSSPMSGQGKKCSFQIWSGNASYINNCNSTGNHVKGEAAGIGITWTNFPVISYSQFINNEGSSIIALLRAANIIWNNIIILKNQISNGMNGSLVSTYLVNFLIIKDSHIFLNSATTFDASFLSKIVLVDCILDQEISQREMNGNFSITNCSYLKITNDTDNVAYNNPLNTYLCWDGYISEKLLENSTSILRYQTTIIMVLIGVGIIILFIIAKRIFYYGKQRRIQRDKLKREKEERDRFIRSSRKINTLVHNEDDNIKTMYLSWLEEEKIFRKAETVSN
ncbi:hypothetical protein TRFO_23085 [Tritrichomonas foetus]|uniref:Uncharacterized protein n=1 Tax=Tritrichomonas foetus TaxID=1144522 RepID=A0A1J4KAF2_9EUKA|nr:hypothetical protein TRFO_23085 [Tritrichomonas foetus]|eukprot:OHT08407.1 hypothetical protein TRFO_23085 [Tritrichomonas foetus]